MLFLAGLLGIATMGAVAFTGFQTETDADDSSSDTNAADHPGSALSEGSDGIERMLDHATTAQAGPGLPDDGPSADEGEIISGTDNADLISGREGPDQINGYGADDTIEGAGGADIVLGGEGQDILSGSDGDDTLHGDGGQDSLQGGAGQDELFGHNGRDLMFGDAGDDTLHGGDGADDLDGGAGDDALHGGLDNDRLFGGDGLDTLFGGWGDDTLSGREGDGATVVIPTLHEADFLNGGGGDDVILAGSQDIVTSGSGADQILLGDWLTQGHEARILDFAPDEDALLVVFDDTLDPEPSVSIGADPESPETRHVLLNGIPIATVLNAPGLTLDHVALLPRTSLADIMGR